MLKLAFIVITITYPLGGHTARIEIGPVPIDYCMQEMARMESAPYLSGIDKLAVVKRECVPVEESQP